MDIKISEFDDGGAVQATDEVAAVRAGGNVKVQFGTAAAANIGTAVGDIIAVQNVSGSPGLPSLDGSLLSNLKLSAGRPITAITSGSGSNSVTGERVVLVNKGTGSATPIVWTHAAGQVLTVKDAKGDAGTNAITITLISGTIDGGANTVISTNKGAVRLVSDGTNAYIV